MLGTYTVGMQEPGQMAKGMEGRGQLIVSVSLWSSAVALQTKFIFHAPLAAAERI